MLENEFYDLIIVGGGPGGLSAGIYALRAALKTILIEKGLPGGQVAISDAVENYPGFEHISGMELSQKFLQHAESCGLEVVQHQVETIDAGPAYHTVMLSNGAILKSHTVILATGGNPRKLNIPGEDAYYGKGVSYCATCDGFFYKNKTVVVVGGGDTAVEEALYLSKIVKKVYLVHRREELRASKILQQKIISEGKVEILWNTIASAVIADDQGVSAVDLKNTQTGKRQELPVDGVFIFVGYIPNKKLVPFEVKTNAEGYVVTNEICETNVPGVYAIGDLREKYAKQIVLAAADGCNGALAAAHYVESRKSETEARALQVN